VSYTPVFCCRES